MAKSVLDANVPFLRGVVRDDRDPPSVDQYPFCLPWFASLNLEFCCPVTFFVGENGSGKSTLLEAIALLSRLPVGGGSRNELGANHTPEQTSALASYVRPWFARRPQDGYFFRADMQMHFASLLESRRDDADFEHDPYKHYGGKSLHARSHGEAFLELITNRFRSGLFLMDEPESALSPQRQLTLLALIARLASDGRSQFIIATHSPILLTFPNAALIDFYDETLSPIPLEETAHYYVTRGILENPEQYWKHLRPGDN
mgnify:CR=1 FL=1